MYRLYISEKGKWKDENKFLRKDILDIFSIIETKMNYLDSSTEFMLIKSADETHGDRIFMYFRNGEKGQQEYFEEKEIMIKRDKGLVYRK